MTNPVPPHADTLPMLRTLGTLQVSGAPLTRPKPMVLLAYLAHEGPTDRDRLARLFFDASDDPRDALCTTLARLGPLVTKEAEWITSRVTTDALEFQRRAVTGEPSTALRWYHGPFIPRAVPKCGIEVEEWLFTTRELLGSLARDAHLRWGTQELQRGRTDAAWRQLKAAIGLTESFALDPEPAVAMLEALDAARVPVPSGWWRALAGEAREPRTRRHAVLP